MEPTDNEKRTTSRTLADEIGDLLYEAGQEHKFPETEVTLLGDTYSSSSSSVFDVALGDREFTIQVTRTK